MGLTLSNFIRGYKIRAECSPILHSPFVRDMEGLYHHKCTLHMSGERRHMTVPYTTNDPGSVVIVRQADTPIYQSRVSTRELLYGLACEAALYAIAKRPIVDHEGKRVAVEHDIDLWASLVYQDDVTLPPPEEVDRLYQSTRRMVYKLRGFLDGPGSSPDDAYAPIFSTLISEVDEVAKFVYNWTIAR